MSGFKVYEQNYPHFLTITALDWMALFTSQPYFRVIADSLKFCQREKGLVLHAYVIMPDHLHLIASSENDLPRIIGLFKSFTAREIVSLMKAENRRLHLWRAREGARKAGEGSHKIWEDGYHPEQIYSPEFLEQKLRYVHDNPVRKGFVAEPGGWLHSSAGFYYHERSGVLEVEPVEW